MGSTGPPALIEGVAKEVLGQESEGCQREEEGGVRYTDTETVEGV